MTLYSQTEGLACSDCGIYFSIPKQYEVKRREDHKTFYCPNGHGQYFPQKSDSDRVKELESVVAHLRDKLPHRDDKGKYTKK